MGLSIADLLRQVSRPHDAILGLAAARQGGGPTRWFVLNTEANVEVDFTALEAVDAVREELGRDGTVFALARVKQDLLDDLLAFGLAQKIGEERIFPTLPTAVAAYRRWASQHPRPEADGVGDAWPSGPGSADRPAGQRRWTLPGRAAYKSS